MITKVLFPSGRILKGALFTVAALVSVLGLVIADSVTKRRDFEGRVVIEVHKKGHQGQWEIVDRLNVQSVRFTTSVLDLAQGKQVTSDHVWEGQTEKGRRLSVRMSQPGRAQVDLAAGKLEIDIVFKFGLEGEDLNVPIHLTTESVSTPGGSISGRRAKINSGNHTATLALVGITKLKVRDKLLEREVADQRGDTENGKSKKNPELFLVFKADGTLTAVDR